MKITKTTVYGTVAVCTLLMGLQPWPFDNDDTQQVLGLIILAGVFALSYIDDPDPNAYLVFKVLLHLAALICCGSYAFINFNEKPFFFFPHGLLGTLALILFCWGAYQTFIVVNQKR